MSDEVFETEPEPVTDQVSAAVVPTIHKELMTPEQKNWFAMKNRARILINMGKMTIDEAMQRNLISEADGAAMRMLSPEQMQQEQIALVAPQGAPVRAKRCC